MSQPVHAPWTAEQVQALNDYQQRGKMHPFTCGAEHATGVSPVLDATASGWICPDPECTYTQTWAWSHMLDFAAGIRDAARQAAGQPAAAVTGATATCRYCGHGITYEPLFRDGREPNENVWSHTGSGSARCSTRPVGWAAEQWPIATPASRDTEPAAGQPATQQLTDRFLAECDAMEQAMANGHASLSRLREHIARIRRVADEAAR